MDIWVLRSLATSLIENKLILHRHKIVGCSVNMTIVATMALTWGLNWDSR